MEYEITTPNGNTLLVDKEDREYFEDIQTRGYKVQRVHNVCTACEG